MSSLNNRWAMQLGGRPMQLTRHNLALGNPTACPIRGRISVRPAAQYGLNDGMRFLSPVKDAVAVRRARALQAMNMPTEPGAGIPASRAGPKLTREDILAARTDMTRSKL